MMKDILCRHGLVLALGFGLAPVYAQQPLTPALKNWPSALYWAPKAGEIQLRRAVQGGVSAQSDAASLLTPPGPMTFIAVTPCRVMDTRVGQGFLPPFGPPTLPASTTREIPIPSSSCNIPSTAGAYSLNITVVPVTVLSFLAVWPSGQVYPGISTLNAPVGGIVANAAIVVAGMEGAIQMVAGNATDVVVDINGYYANPTDQGANTGMGSGVLVSNTGSENTGVGYLALNANTSGNQNTATGGLALSNNTIGIGNTASGFGSLEANVSGNNNTASGYSALNLNTTGFSNTANGSGALQNNTVGNQNTATGAAALFSNVSGQANTASGQSALQNNITGNNNTASGQFVLLSNTSGSGNTATGQASLITNTTGFSNTTSGLQSMQNNTTGNSNTASGLRALFFNTTGSANTAIGEGSLINIVTGSNNTAIGPAAGSNLANGDSNNVQIANLGVTGDTGVIRIGTAILQNSFFAAGIRGVTTGNQDAVPVMIDSNGQLGTVSSSIRFKQDVEDMGAVSDDLMRLRPVTFRYRKPYADGSKPMQYGLIAEEVNQVYPDLVAHSADGQVETVKYQVLDSMLLNEAQHQQAQIKAQKDQLGVLQQELSQEHQRNLTLEERLDKIEAALVLGVH